MLTYIPTYVALIQAVSKHKSLEEKIVCSWSTDGELQMDGVSFPEAQYFYYFFWEYFINISYSAVVRRESSTAFALRSKFL